MARLRRLSGELEESRVVCERGKEAARIRVEAPAVDGRLRVMMDSDKTVR